MALCKIVKYSMADVIILALSVDDAVCSLGVGTALVT